MSDFSAKVPGEVQAMGNSYIASPLPETGAQVEAFSPRGKFISRYRIFAGDRSLEIARRIAESHNSKQIVSKETTDYAEHGSLEENR